MENLYLFNLRQRSRSNEPQTQTIVDQIETEQLVRRAYYEKLSKWKDRALCLFRLNHIDYLTRKLVSLPTSFQNLDASQPWLAYWMVHSLRLLNFVISDETKFNLVQFLKATQHTGGGFGGGAYQHAHLATTYGAVNCLVSLCRQDALDLIDRPGLLCWFKQLRQKDGSFVMHIGGESDVRGAYCAVAVAKLTGLYNENANLFDHTAEWIASCQSYEGGFGAQPGVEAHGGYTFCAVAALCLLGRPDLINVSRLLRWIAHRQMVNEGGFQGRTNKLVDSCYSFWQGAVFPIVEELLFMANDPALSEHETLFNVGALQEYILFCCQKVFFTRPGLSVPYQENLVDVSPSTGYTELPAEVGGGLIDKPGRNVDCYHTCYALSGLSVAQHCPRPRYSLSDMTEKSSAFTTLGKPIPAPAVDTLSAHLNNELADLDPLHNVLHDGLAYATTYFREKDTGTSSTESIRLAEQAMEKCYLQVKRHFVEDNRVTMENIRSPEPDQFVSTCTAP